MKRNRNSSTPLFAIGALILVGLLGCAGGDEAPAGDASEAHEPLVVYSGRSQSLVGPLLGNFPRATGIPVDIRFGSTSEMTATLLEEGSYSPADLFISQDAGALGALSKAGMLKALSEATLSAVPERFRSSRGDWVGLSGRARVIVYNTETMTPEQLPQTLEEVLDPKWKGRWGVAPTNASFQAHMALYGAMNGSEALETLLAGMVANEPKRYPKNTPIVAAAIAGEIDWGLTNHYYLWRALKENPQATGANYFMPGGDASSFVNMAGAALLSDNEQAVELLNYMVSEEAQRYFAEETFEYPLIEGVAAAAGLPALADFITPSVDYADVSAALEDALRQIGDSGLLEN
jgi:iron(III) transport system substrate-binding protein